MSLRAFSRIWSTLNSVRGAMVALSALERVRESLRGP